MHQGQKAASHAGHLGPLGMDQVASSEIEDYSFRIQDTMTFFLFE